MAEADDIKAAMDRLKSYASKPAQDREIVVEVNNFPAFMAALKELGEIELLVGIPEGSARQEGDIDNASLGYIHETGSPINNIPPRPFLRPGVQNSQGQWLPYIQRAGEAAMQIDAQGNFDSGGITANFTKAGIIAVNAVRGRIDAGIPPPIKRPRYKRGRDPVRPAEATPLVDTGQLRRAITYVINKRPGE